MSRGQDEADQGRVEQNRGGEPDAEQLGRGVRAQHEREVAIMDVVGGQMTGVVEALPGERTAGGRRRRGLRGSLLVAGAFVVCFAVWWFASVHPGQHLGGSAVTMACFLDGDVDGADVVRGGLRFVAPTAVEVLAVRLVAAENIEIADARVAPQAKAAPGTDAAGLGTAVGWPVADREQYAMDWSRDRPLVGAHLAAGVEELPYLHLRVLDRSLEASYTAWQVEYRMRGTRWVSTFTTGTTVAAAGSSADPCDDEAP